MKLKCKIINGLKIYEIPSRLINEMFEVAIKAATNTFPTPNKVSCAVLTKNGNIYPGAEYRADILTLSMHAEATALSHSAIHGDPEIIAITGPNCHACKQLLWENAMHFGNDIIILIKKDGKVDRVPLSSMMSYAWPENRWENKGA
ncbi:MAG: cytidine deaminase [Patescibacteria group bacterium]